MSMTLPTRVDDKLRAVAQDALRAPERADWPSDPALARLRELGTELWLDTGNLHEAEGLWTREFTALTTNNTLANQVVQSGELDDIAREAARDLAEQYPGIGLDELVLEIGFVVNCHLALRLVKALGAKVSVELHPAVAQDIDRTVHYAERYYAVCPERFYVKVPLTPEGYCAVARLSAKGIPVNYTLGFSARQNYLAAILSKPAFCNVFLGRLNAVISENRLGDGKMVGEKATIATQQAVRQLREQGRTHTRLIAASMREADQVTTLAGCDVFTVPPKVAESFVAGKPDPASLHAGLTQTPQVEFYPSVDAKRVEVLWTVDDKLRRLAEELCARNVEELTGDAVREADADIGSGLFHRFTTQEVVEIREQGKIPNWSRWEDEQAVALDDLMTQSALQSFTTDQAALDEHLRRLA